jgi:hypothetical protein
MNEQLDTRSWLLCTEHLVIIHDDHHGSCPQCNGDRNLIVVVPASRDSNYVEAES